MARSTKRNSVTRSQGTRAPRANTAKKPSVRDEVRVFISYANADSGIANALYEELIKIDKNRVRCFLDTKTIGSGKNWKKQLDDFLAIADWLICIYTGEHSEFCGYEIGVFEKVNNLFSKGKDSPVVCLHDVPNLPIVFHPHQNRVVLFPPDPAQQTKQFDENEFYLQSPIAKFFGDIYKYKNLYVLKDASETQRQTQTLVGQVKCISEAFKAARGTDIRADTPIQLQLDVYIPSLQGEPLSCILESAEVTGTFASFKLFDLLPPMIGNQRPATTWGALKRASSSEYRAVAPWIERLERDMLDAANGRVPNSVEGTLSSNDKVYRSILSRYVLFENGARKFEILFVESLPRQFLGKKHTSLMLAGIVLAARFRFAYLAEHHTLSNKIDDLLSKADFEANCWQLHYDLDRLRLEAIELGILDPIEFIKSFGEDKRGIAENLLNGSLESRLVLYEKLPAPGEHIKEADRASIKKAIITYFEQVEPLNRQFLTEGLEIFKDEMLSQMKASLVAYQLSENKLPRSPG